MNALFQRTSPLAANMARRQASSVAGALPRKPFVPNVYHARTFQGAWFSDPSTYPLLAVLAAAGFFIVGASANAFMHYDDVRINPAIKHKVIRDWGDKPKRSMTEAIASKPYLEPEGLGVSHAKWKAQKQDYASS